MAAVKFLFFFLLSRNEMKRIRQKSAAQVAAAFSIKRRFTFVTIFDWIGDYRWNSTGSTKYTIHTQINTIIFTSFDAALFFNSFFFSFLLYFFLFFPLFLFYFVCSSFFLCTQSNMFSFLLTFCLLLDVLIGGCCASIFTVECCCL